MDSLSVRWQESVIVFSQYFYSGVCYSIVLKIMLLKILFYVLKNRVDWLDLLKSPEILNNFFFC